MNIKNCPRCDRIFVPQPGRSFCAECMREEEQYFEAVREYLRDYPGASMLEVANGTGVDVDTILRYIKEGRIESSSFPGTVLTCERCGAPVSDGRLCADCQGEMMREFQQAANSLKPGSQTPVTTPKGKDQVYSAKLKDRLK